MFHFVVEYIQNLLFYITYYFGVYSINVYLYIKDNFFHKNENIQFVASFYHLNNEIVEYKVTHNDEIHNLKFLKEDVNNFLEFSNLDELLESKNKILHCCLVDEHEDMILDCTDELRCFRFYFINKDSFLTWHLFLEHAISLQSNHNINLKSCKLMLCKNDNNLSELNFDINDENLASYIDL